MSVNSAGKIDDPATGSVAGSTPGTMRVCHTPERSGCPPAVRGERAARFGLPSRPFGTPGVGWLIHWAATGADHRQTMHSATDFIGDLGSILHLCSVGTRSPCRH